MMAGPLVGGERGIGCGLAVGGDLLIGRSAKSGKLLRYGGPAHLLTASRRGRKGKGPQPRLLPALTSSTRAKADCTLNPPHFPLKALWPLAVLVTAIPSRIKQRIGLSAKSLSS